MRAESHTIRPREFAADRWILESDARSAIVYAHPAFVATETLVGSTIRVDGCEYRCVAVERGDGEPLPPGVRLRLFVESL
jgi:hypothetical protein